MVPVDPSSSASSPESSPVSAVVVVVARLEDEEDDRRELLEERRVLESRELGDDSPSRRRCLPGGEAAGLVKETAGMSPRAGSMNARHIRAG